MKLIEVKLNIANIKAVENLAVTSLKKTAETVHKDLQDSQTMPFDSGELQNRSTFVDDSNASKGKTTIVSDTPYARRLYFHPEYKFSKDENPNASGEWFETYINGEKKDYAQKVFAQLMKKGMDQIK